MENAKELGLIHLATVISIRENTKMVRRVELALNILVQVRE